VYSKHHIQNRNYVAYYEFEKQKYIEVKENLPVYERLPLTFSGESPVKTNSELW
jgi:hypothetical protein